MEIPPDLILRARRGDSIAFHRLVDALSGLTFNIAWRMTANRADAEDMSQEVFLRLHRHFATYDPRLPFLPWFRRLTTNACLNWCRADRLRESRRTRIVISGGPARGFAAGRSPTSRRSCQGPPSPAEASSSVPTTTTWAGLRSEP